MKDLKKKLINKIFRFMGIEEVQYGCREITFRNIIKELLVVLVFWIVSIYFLVKEEHVFIRALLTWLVIFLPFEIIYFISTFLYFKKDKSDKNRVFKEKFFYSCLVIFVILTFPYFLLSNIVNDLEFQNLFEYGEIFILENLLLIYLFLALIHTWTSNGGMAYADAVFIIISSGYFLVYLLLRKLIRWVFIREIYNRCEYILEYHTLMNGLHIIGSLVLAIISFYSKEMVIVLIIYMLLETLSENLRRNKRKYDLVLTLFKETLFVLNKVIPTIKSYDTLIIRLKYSIDEKTIENYATLYKAVNDTRQRKKLQRVIDAYNQLLNQKYDCTEPQNRDELHNDMTKALNIAAKYLLSYL